MHDHWRLNLPKGAIPSHGETADSVSFVVAFSMVSGSAAAQVFDWLSVGIGGVAGTGDSGLEDARRAISADGRYVVFESTAENFVSADDNLLMDVYVGHGPTALWIDGFETGDTIGWSATTP